jgi:hypothetical protein
MLPGRLESRQGRAAKSLQGRGCRLAVGETGCSKPRNQLVPWVPVASARATSTTSTADIAEPPLANRPNTST